jgi:hypothetical protein
MSVTVIEDLKSIHPKGTSGTLNVGRPKVGTIKSFEIGIDPDPTTQKRVIATLNSGEIVNGRMSLADLGEIEVLATAHMAWTHPVLIMSSNQLHKLISLLGSADSQGSVQK